MVGDDAPDDEPKKRRLLGCGGVGVFLIALVTAATVIALKQTGGGADAEASVAGGDNARQSAPAAAPQQVPLPTRGLPTFTGKHTRSDGRVSDKDAGVSYPKLKSPWRLPSKDNALGERGFTAQRYVVTEQGRGSQLWYGQLMSGALSNAQGNLYGGRGTERQAAAALARQFEDRFYSMPHKRREVASQELTVDDRKGWVVAYFVSYERPGVKATGDMVAVAVVDTGRAKPAVVFMAVPNTHRKLWPDFNYVLGSLGVLSDSDR
jgi:hypothetical protein